MRAPDEMGATGLAATTSGRIRVLLADDESTIREALAELVRSDESLELVAAAGDAEEAIRLAAECRPDVVLLDVKMPGGGGVRAAQGIGAVCPQARMIAFSAYEDHQTLVSMLRAGAVGYLVKGTSVEDILGTIHRAAQGLGALSPEVTADVIHELVDLLERSERQARELQEVDRVKSELIQILSHELLTPVASIQGFAATVRAWGERISMDQIEELAKGAARAGTRLRRLVANLATAARFDRAGLDLSTRPCSLGEVVQIALAEFSDENRVRTPAPDDLDRLAVWADPQLASRALVVVLENALAFSAPDQAVDLTAEADDETLHVVVTDRGSGIPPEARERLFEAFRQADSSTTRAHGGLGIGLYLARRIMAAHGGSIDLVSPPEGGTRVTLIFPSVAVDGRTLGRASQGALPAFP